MKYTKILTFVVMLMELISVGLSAYSEQTINPFSIINIVLLAMILSFKESPVQTQEKESSIQTNS
jgi:hypothetical protein